MLTNGEKLRNNQHAKLCKDVKTCQMHTKRKIHKRMQKQIHQAREKIMEKDCKDMDGGKES